MDLQKRLFRKAALDKMASPERLDEMMEVTSPAGWLALVALGVALAGAVVWSVFGSIAIKVHGSGILIRGEAVRAVTAGSNGRLEEILIRSGDVVEQGDVVARVGRSDLVQELDQARAERRRLMVQDEEQTASDGSILAQLASQRRELKARVEDQEELIRKGAVTRGKLLSTKSQLAQIEQSIAQHKAAQTNRRNRIAEVQDEIETLESRLASSSELRTPYSGRVLELGVNEGEMVAPGTRLLTLEALEGPIDAVVYIPAADGKKVEEGMEIRVSPSTVKAEEYGYIIGNVRRASVYPVTPEGMKRVLSNLKLADSLTGEGAKIEVTAFLIEDPATESGFRWSSSKGPPSEVYTGTLCTASVIVETKRPISYVLPILKKAVGMS